MSIEWVPPNNNGGCPILSYEIYFDDGSSGPFVTKAETDISEKPYLREYTFNFNNAQTGLIFRYKIVSINEIGSASSSIKSQLLASIPSAPTSAPQSDLSTTSYNILQLSW